MYKLIPDFDMTKVILWDNKKIIIENYQKLFDIEENKIKVDKYLIIGQNLKITELDQFIIKIYGEIKELKIE